jgi:hypothetical protein
MMSASRVASLLVAIAGVAGVAGPAQAQAPSPQACLQPASEALARACDEAYRYCTKPPNDEWKKKWRALCATRGSGGAAAGGAMTGTATVTSTEGRMAYRSVATVRWVAKPGSRTEYVASGTLTVSGTSGACTGRQTVDLRPDDGELEVRRGADGKVAQYRGMGMKMMSLAVVCPKAAGVGVVPVAWFNTLEDFRAVKDGVMQGSMTDPDQRWKWEWTFTP